MLVLLKASFLVLYFYWEWLADFNSQNAQLVSFDQSNNSAATDVKLDISVIY